MSQSKPQPYTVRDIRVIAKGADVLVREYTLDPGEAIPWHRHSEISDHFYGLEGTFVVETRNPQARYQLGVGQSAKVSPPTVHHATNPGTRPCRFLLVQGVGRYDFVRADSAEQPHA